MINQNNFRTVFKPFRIGVKNENTNNIPLPSLRSSGVFRKNLPFGF